MRSISPLRAVLSIVGALLALALLIVGVKAASLWKQSANINTQVRQIGIYYRETIQKDTAAIPAATRMNAEQSAALQNVRQLKLDDRQSPNTILTTIVAMQQAVTKLFDTVEPGDPLGKDKAFQM